MTSIADVSHALRLLPGADLKEAIKQYVKEKHIEAGWIISCVGSLTKYNIRFANLPQGTSANGYFEIISLTGTVSKNGLHIHICVADENGKTVGGHLLPGCIIYTTAEVIIAESTKYIFTREKDNTTSFYELQIKEK